MIKPSELPKGSVIGNYNDGLWFKDSNMWIAIAPIGIALYVSDTGFGENLTMEHVSKPADKYFRDWDVVSLPVGWDIHRGSLVKRQDV